MKQKFLSILVASLAAISLFGIVSVLERPAQAADTTTTTTTTDPDPLQFARGAKAWANNCSRCHNMRDPKELRDDQWRAAMTHMRIRGALTGEETRDILAFLQESN